MKKITGSQPATTTTAAQLSEQQQRINTWIERLEQQANDLIAGVALDELSAKERVDLAVKIMGQLQRFLALRQQAEQAASPAPAANTQVLIANLMRQMRGEAVPASAEKPAQPQ